mmetsp:Transcript_1840/g.3991  ORF Transcript_1840/g.3991 Transcript_1840/m.3991 type:complete len:257 (-) Transcript_1840:764-1534(-)
MGKIPLQKSHRNLILLLFFPSHNNFVLRTLSIDNGTPKLLILLPRNPHILKGPQTPQNTPPQPRTNRPLGHGIGTRHLDPPSQSMLMYNRLDFLSQSIGEGVFVPESGADPGGCRRRRGNASRGGSGGGGGRHGGADSSSAVETGSSAADDDVSEEIGLLVSIAEEGGVAYHLGGGGGCEVVEVRVSVGVGGCVEGGVGGVVGVGGGCAVGGVVGRCGVGMGRKGTEVGKTRRIQFARDGGGRIILGTAISGGVAA